MLLTVEGLKRLEDMDIRNQRREDLDIAEDMVIDRQKSANQRISSTFYLQPYKTV